MSTTALPQRCTGCILNYWNFYILLFKVVFEEPRSTVAVIHDVCLRDLDDLISEQPSEGPLLPLSFLFRTG